MQDGRKALSEMSDSFGLAIFSARSGDFKIPKLPENKIFLPSLANPPKLLSTKSGLSGDFSMMKTQVDTIIGRRLMAFVKWLLKADQNDVYMNLAALRCYDLEILGTDGLKKFATGALNYDLTCFVFKFNELQME